MFVSTPYGHVLIAHTHNDTLAVSTRWSAPVQVNRQVIDIQPGTELRLHPDGVWRFGEPGHWATSMWELNVRRHDITDSRDVTEAARRALRDALEMAVNDWVKHPGNFEHERHTARSQRRRDSLDVAEGAVRRAEEALERAERELDSARERLAAVKARPLEDF